MSLEKLFIDLLDFCLKEKKKTLFLISQDEAQHDPQMHSYIKQLMDFKLIHVVEPDTSAASKRSGRYEAYTLDYASFMEPRRRGIDIVEFWETDKHYNKKGVREAPTYSLDRARNAVETIADPQTEKVINEVLATDLSEGGDEQQELFKP